MQMERKEIKKDDSQNGIIDVFNMSKSKDKQVHIITDRLRISLALGHLQHKRKEKKENRRRRRRKKKTKEKEDTFQLYVGDERIQHHRMNTLPLPEA